MAYQVSVWDLESDGLPVEGEGATAETRTAIEALKTAISLMRSSYPPPRYKVRIFGVPIDDGERGALEAECERHGVHLEDFLPPASPQPRR